MTTNEQTASDPTPPPAPSDAVRTIVGRWTVRGMEETYTEICELFPGEHHLVCYATSQKGDRVSRHMSIITWSAEEACYLYFGIGSGGSVRTQRGEFNAGVWTFHGTETIEGVRVSVWVVMTPIEEGYHFLERHSADGETWVADADFDYLRLKTEA